ncbi:MAG: hypothetical protein IT572_08360 [Deltaproteobacteria bacterium]|nr:hypothetical protein [Deltaproteobacteria bacterium]
MFPRVLGYLTGRAAAIAVNVYQRLTGQESDSGQSKSIDRQIDRYVAPALIFAGTAALPLPLRVPAALALTLPTALRLGRELLGEREVEATGFLGNESLDCYFRAASESDPLLLSPVGTLPFDRCLRP